MAGDLKKRVGLVASVLLTLVGTISFPSDASELAKDIIKGVADNPLGSVLILAGIALAVYALRDEILDALNIQSTPRLAHRIKDSLLLDHDWGLDEVKIESDSFRIAAKHGGRTLTFLKSRNDPALTIGSGIVPDDESRKLLDGMPDASRNLLRQDLVISLSLIANIELSIDYDKNNTVKRIAFMNRIEMAGGFSDFRLFEGISAVVRAGAVVEAQILKCVAQNPS